MITRNNYELFFIDYLEGNLSTNEKAMVENFLVENPDLKEELDLICSDELQLSDDSEPPLDFSFLKKEALINEENEDEFFIGRIEQDLSQEQEKLLDLYLIENPSKREKMESYKQTILVPELMSFPNKRRLKRTRSIGVYYRLTIGVAAAMLLLFYVNIKMDDMALQPAFFADKIEIERPIIKEAVKPEENTNPMIDSREEKATTINLASRPSNHLSQPSLTQKPKREEEIIEKMNVAKKEFPVLDKDLKINQEIEFNDQLLASNEVKRKSMTPREYIKEKSSEYASEKTGREIKSSGDLLSFASSSIKLPKFIKYSKKSTDKQEVKTVKIGRNFKVKRKKRK